MNFVKRKAVVVAIVVGVTISGLTAGLAAAGVFTLGESSNGRIYGCVNGSNGQLTIRLPGTSCGSNHLITWLGDLIQATVQPNGTFGNAWGIKSVTHPSTGVYDLTTYNSTSNCVQTASLAFTPGEISVEGNANNVADEIQVQTYNATGAPANQTFQLIESCA